MNNSTLKFKYAFIDDVLRLGSSIEEVEVYEDRIVHRDAFQDYLSNWRRVKGDSDNVKMEAVDLDDIGLKSFNVHFVELPVIHFKEDVEERLVTKMMEDTNEADFKDGDQQYILERKVISMGYRLHEGIFTQLFKKYVELSVDTTTSEWRIMRRPSVFIHYKSTPDVLNKVGGIGKKVEFKVTHYVVSDKILALQLAPLASYSQARDGNGKIVLKPDRRTTFWTKSRVPALVLATRNGGKPSDVNAVREWTTIPSSIENQQFMSQVVVNQELSIVLVSKEAARPKEGQARPRSFAFNGQTIPSRNDHISGQRSFRKEERPGRTLKRTPNRE